jgi:hypothetical protein
MEDADSELQNSQFRVFANIEEYTSQQVAWSVNWAKKEPYLLTLAEFVEFVAAAACTGIA